MFQAGCLHCGTGAGAGSRRFRATRQATAATSRNIPIGDAKDAQRRDGGIFVLNTDEGLIVKLLADIRASCGR